MILQDLQMVCLIMVLAVLLFFFAGFADKNKNSLWRLFYLLPMLIVFIYLAIADYESALLPAYLGAALLAVGFFKERVQTRKYACIIGAFLTFLSILVCNLYSGYRVPDFEKEFEETFAEMKEHYCLTEHKGIDWDYLHEKYYVKFRESNRKHDEVENGLIWLEFTGEFYDGHVNYSLEDVDLAQKVFTKALGNDYGLSLVLLSDGRIGAANVEKDSEAQKAGLYNGAIVTAWDGKDPKELAKNYVYTVMNMPDGENEEFYKILTVAGMGAEQVRVDFIDKDGNEKQTTLTKIGPYYERVKETAELLDRGMNIGTLTFVEIDEDTVLYRVKQMGYDAKSYQTGNHSGYEKELREQLLAWRDAGKKNLIIDLRCNGGGSPHMIMVMAKLLGSEGKHFYVKEALIDEEKCAFVKEQSTGRYVPGEDINFIGEDLWKDGKIVILVNGRCISAGDHFTQAMGNMDNVTIAGLTKSNASGQAIGYIPTHNGGLSYSQMPVLDQNGDIYIDTGTDHRSKLNFDVKIPLDSEALVRIFENDEDYVLDYTMTHLLK